MEMRTVLGFHDPYDVAILPVLVFQQLGLQMVERGRKRSEKER